MIYELRQWSDEDACLYTDDQRVKDLAVQTPGLSITSRYFRTARAPQPFAWDIVGPKTVLAPLAGNFSAGAGRRRR